MCLPSSKHHLVALIFSVLLYTQQMPTFCCLHKHWSWFLLNLERCTRGISAAPFCKRCFAQHLSLLIFICSHVASLPVFLWLLFCLTYIICTQVLHASPPYSLCFFGYRERELGKGMSLTCIGMSIGMYFVPQIFRGSQSFGCTLYLKSKD